MAGSAQDWQVGDLALRLRDGHWRDLDLGVMTTEGPPPGSVNRVIGLRKEREGLGLRLEGWPEFIFSACSFRKIRPHTPDAQDAETIALLNGQPVEPATPELV